MKRILTTIVFLLSILHTQAVLKEKDLPHTLGVLKAELKADFEKQKQNMQRYEQMNIEQHAKLISYMKRSEQVGLILYSQKQDFTFDMAFACQEATRLYRELSFNTVPYERIQTRLRQEIERYNGLVTLLQQLPPAIGEAKDSITQVDSLLLSEVDTLAIRQVVEDVAVKEKDGYNHDAFILEGEELQNRQECLYYAREMLQGFEYFIESITQEQRYYDQVAEKVEKLHSFAQSRYKILQQSIFRDGGSNYIKVLFNLPRQLEQVKRDIQSKYRPLATEGNGVSEWRGMYVIFISFFIIIYISLSILISNIVMRWLMPKRLRTDNFKQKRHMFINVLGVALFAISVMIARTFTDRNIVLMGTSLMITFAWLIEAVFLSLLIRLKGDQMKSGARIYMPFICMAMIVIVFRIVLIPNTLINLIYPPILLLFTIWQGRTLKIHREQLPHSDMFYSTISFLAMIVACVAAWLGYTLLAVEVMIWWMFQLTAIQTITCAYDLLKMYEENRLVYLVFPKLRKDEKKGIDTTEQKELLKDQIKRGKFISQTWIFDFVHKAAVPILAVLSILVSIYWAAEIFEMTSLCRDAFFYKFIDEKDVISLSFFKIVMVCGSWFFFRYLNYALRSLYHHIRRRTLGESKEDYNTTLANNVVSILVWGAYFIYALVLLRVPSSGISIVTAGLATGMGFAMKDLLENFFYGISLMSGRVRVGDYIECEGIRGRVEKITYQSTMIYTMDGCVIAFLNSSLFSKNFKNLTRNHQYELVKIPVGVAYGSNVKEVRYLLEQALQPITQEKNAGGKMLIDEEKPISVAFSNFGDNSVDLLVCIWMLVEETNPLTCRVKEIIYDTLNLHHIEIPFPQRDIYIHNV